MAIVAVTKVGTPVVASFAFVRKLMLVVIGGNFVLMRFLAIFEVRKLVIKFFGVRILVVFAMVEA